MTEVLKALFSSKKFLALLVSLLVIAGVKLGLDEETATFIADRVVVLGSGYLLGQGIADHGKERAKVEVLS